MSNRRLDYLAGERLLGYTIYHYDKDVAERCYYMLMDANFDPVYDLFKGERKTEAEAWEDCPYFGSDWGAAMIALRTAINKHGWDVEIEYRKRDGTWGYFVDVEPVLHLGQSEGYDDPSGVIIAILRAVGTPEDEIRGAIGTIDKW